MFIVNLLDCKNQTLNIRVCSLLKKQCHNSQMSLV
jgi:hypothetical protein